jgi:hypothetical protein
VEPPRISSEEGCNLVIIWPYSGPAQELIVMVPLLEDEGSGDGTNEFGTDEFGVVSSMVGVRTAVWGAELGMD